ncbi:hypothetical protein THAOC_26161, partial [Thalassiosira oceanica]
ELFARPNLVLALKLQAKLLVHSKF